MLWEGCSMCYMMLQEFFQTAGVSSHCNLVNTLPLDCCFHVGIQNTGGLKPFLSFYGNIQVL